MSYCAIIIDDELNGLNALKLLLENHCPQIRIIAGTQHPEEGIHLIEKLKPKKGIILFSKDGSVGTAYLLRDDLDGITSGAILHLKVKNSKEILPEYLTLALNSKLVQMQAERDAKERKRRQQE